MAKKFYQFNLDEANTVSVQFLTERRSIKEFVVKYYATIENINYEVIRFDSFHKCPHKDILRPDGSVERKVFYEFMSNKQGLNFAVLDIKENYPFYRERFIKWLREQSEK
jgi:hypothetical protein